jgi:pimeloyl-ACP methyl ester carboxylesterase
MKSVPILVCGLIFNIICNAQQKPPKVLDIDLKNYDYPFPVHFISLKSQQEKLEMAFMDVVPANANGKVVVLLHGKNFNGAYWRATAKALSMEGYRIIIPDQIGFGKSSKPIHYQYTFQQLALNTKAILDSLKIENVSILGHSMGGMLASRFALMFPSRTAKLILVNPIGLEDWKLKVPYQSIDRWYQNELKQTYEAIKKYQMQNYYDNQWKPEYDEWVNILAGWTMNKEYKKIAWISALTYDMIFTQPVVYEFGNIRVPSLLIIGQRDRTALGKNTVDDETRQTMGNYPELGRATQEKIPDSKLVELDGVGHLPHIEAFNRFIEPLVKFLAE